MGSGGVGWGQVVGQVASGGVRCSRGESGGVRRILQPTADSTARKVDSE